MAQTSPTLAEAGTSATMNTVARGGFAPRHDRYYTYYETIAGGAGAGPRGPGLSGVHTHMTNTLNTPVEALELAYPFRTEEYGLRHSSAGAGRFAGGEGVVRRYRFLAPATVTIVSERRTLRPWGLNGGSPAAPGENLLLRADGSRHVLPAKTAIQVQTGDALEIRTPGGGGWGTSEE